MGYTLQPPTEAPPSSPSSGRYSLTAPPAVSDPTEGMSFLENLRLGTGKSFNDLGLGAQQLAAMVGLGDPAAVQAKIDEQRRLDAPLMNTGGGMAGNVIGNILTGALVPGGQATVLGRVLAATAGGAAQGALQPTSGDESRVANTALGAGANALGAGIAAGVGRALRPSQAATPEIAAAQRFAQSQGSGLSFGQLTGNDLVKRLEFWLAKFPGGRGWYESLGEAQRGAVDKAIGSMSTVTEKNIGGGATIRSAGEQLNKLQQGRDFFSDPDFVSALRSLPDQFKNLAGGMKPKGALAAAAEYAGREGVPNPALTALGATAREQAIAQGVPETVGGAAAKLPPGSSIPMDEYQTIRSQLGRLSRGAAEGSPDAVGYKALRKAFDEAADRSLMAQGVEAGSLAEARNAYQVQTLLRGAEVQGADGSVTYSPVKAANIIDRAIRDGDIKNLPKETQMRLRDLMAFGRSVKPVSTSGTAENLLAMKPSGLGLISGGLSPLVWAANRALQSFGEGVDAPMTGATLARIMATLPAPAAISAFAGQ
jgi:hypothetical protein